MRFKEFSENYITNPHMGMGSEREQDQHLLELPDDPQDPSRRSAVLGGLGMFGNLFGLGRDHTANQGAEPAKPRAEPPLTQNPLASVLEKTARSKGIHGLELAALMGQCYVETIGYTTLVERPNKWMKWYEPPSKTATILGNTQKGDGKRYIGRGFIQVTGRWNYTQFQQDSGLPVIAKPELLATPTTAAQGAVNYWLHRIRPNVSNWRDAVKITELVSGNQKHRAERESRSLMYASRLDPNTSPVVAAPAGTTVDAKTKENIGDSIGMNQVGGNWGDSPQ